MSIISSFQEGYRRAYNDIDGSPVEAGPEINNQLPAFADSWQETMESLQPVNPDKVEQMQAYIDTVAAIITNLEQELATAKAYLPDDALKDLIGDTAFNQLADGDAKNEVRAQVLAGKVMELLVDPSDPANPLNDDALKYFSGNFNPTTATAGTKEVHKKFLEKLGRSETDVNFSNLGTSGSPDKPKFVQTDTTPDPWDGKVTADQLKGAADLQSKIQDPTASADIFPNNAIRFNLFTDFTAIGPSPSDDEKVRRHLAVVHTARKLALIDAVQDPDSQILPPDRPENESVAQMYDILEPLALDRQLPQPAVAKQIHDEYKAAIDAEIRASGFNPSRLGDDYNSIFTLIKNTLESNDSSTDSIIQAYTALSMHPEVPQPVRNLADAAYKALLVHRLRSLEGGEELAQALQTNNLRTLDLHIPAHMALARYISAINETRKAINEIDSDSSYDDRLKKKAIASLLESMVVSGDILPETQESILTDIDNVLGEYITDDNERSAVAELIAGANQSLLTSGALTDRGESIFSTIFRKTLQRAKGMVPFMLAMQGAGLLGLALGTGGIPIIPGLLAFTGYGVWKVITDPSKKLWSKDGLVGVFEPFGKMLAGVWQGVSVLLSPDRSFSEKRDVLLGMLGTASWGVLAMFGMISPGAAVFSAIAGGIATEVYIEKVLGAKADKARANLAISLIEMADYVQDTTEVKYIDENGTEQTATNIRMPVVIRSLEHFVRELSRRTNKDVPLDKITVVIQQLLDDLKSEISTPGIDAREKKQKQRRYRHFAILLAVASDLFDKDTGKLLKLVRSSQVLVQYTDAATNVMAGVILGTGFTSMVSTLHHASGTDTTHQQNTSKTASGSSATPNAKALTPATSGTQTNPAGTNHHWYHPAWLDNLHWPFGKQHTATSVNTTSPNHPIQQALDQGSFRMPPEWINWAKLHGWRSTSPHASIFVNHQGGNWGDFQGQALRLMQHTGITPQQFNSPQGAHMFNVLTTHIASGQNVDPSYAQSLYRSLFAQ